MVTTACAAVLGVRLNRVMKALGVDALGVVRSQKARAEEVRDRRAEASARGAGRGDPGAARVYPWWGFEREGGQSPDALGSMIANKQVYKVMKAAGLLQFMRRVRTADDRTRRRGCSSMLPSVPNELWARPT